MKNTFAHTSVMGMNNLKKIVEECVLGDDTNARGMQPPIFKETPMVFCSYIGRGYSQVYGGFSGITFETDSPIIYACPADSWTLVRNGSWLPGYEKFLFKSLEEMIATYPTSKSFKKAFKKYFKELDPYAMYSSLNKTDAEIYFRRDFCLRPEWNPGCNEITFPKPLTIKNPQIFARGKLK